MPYGDKPTRSKRTGYSSYIDHYAKYGKAARRIKMPGVPKRPLRFQLRTLLRKEGFRGKSTWWLTVHRRGIRRDRVGISALEQRAVPASLVPGFLTERILYATLVNLFHFVPGVDFLFQSSVQGGRLEMGGLVADFLFPILRVVINPLGPQHYQFRNMAKDEEQVAILDAMGYDAYLIDEEVIYDELALEEFLRRIFGWIGSGGSDVGAFPARQTSSREREELDMDALYDTIKDLEVSLYGFFA
jgi:G:T-mismatch repair DNA endonuclease (very short patch repair protein)